MIRRNRVKERGEAVLMLLWWAFNPLFIIHYNSASYHEARAGDQSARFTTHGPGNTAEKCLKCGDNVFFIG